MPFLLLSARSLAGRGFERIFATVSTRNDPSNRTFERAGFRALLRIRKRGSRYRFDRDHLR